MSINKTQEGTSTTDNRKSLLPDYLKENDFTVELNYKLWVTKGSRFKAAERCERQNDRYTKIIAFVSAYMIIINVINICRIPTLSIDDNFIITITTGFSIILLVASQFIYARNYAVKAERFHCCALDISDIYNRLRIEKDKNKMDIKGLTDEYESILTRCDNHLPIDYEMFKLTKADYFKLSWWKIVRTHFIYFKVCDSMYYFSMIGVPVLYILLALYLNDKL